MKIFADSELKKEIAEIDFGEVEVGKKKDLTLYLHNETSGLARNLIFNVDQQIAVSDCPVLLEAKETKPFKLSWTPTVDFKQPLNTKIEVKGTVVYREKR